MKKNKLLENTIMLYILTFSSYFFNFITIPYQTRILGPELFGKIGLALAIATYFKLLFDFGFILSGTEEVSKNRNNTNKLSTIVSSITTLKIIFIILGIILLYILLNSINTLKDYKLLYFLYFIYVAIESFQPDYLYRGIENMKIITIRNVIIKGIFTILIFVFLKEKSQYLLIPIFMILGSFFSVIAMYINLYKKYNIRIKKVSQEEVLNEYNNSKIFFLSRIASTVYGATNTFILGLIYPHGNTLGYYTSSEKILNAGRSAMTPIADSLYPYMVKNKDFKLVKKILKTTMPIITIGCIVFFIYANPICLLVFGKEYIGAGLVLRYMIPLIWLTLPNYVLGFPTMTPLGLKKEANMSVIIGSIYQIIGIAILYVNKLLNLNSICILTISTELIILLLRISYIYKERRRP